MKILAWPNDPHNPYTRLLYSEMGDGNNLEFFSSRSLLNRYNIWHVHWPESLLNIRNAAEAALKLAAFFTAIETIKWRGGKIIWTVHNLKAHEALHPEMESRFWRHFIPRVDGVISLSESGLSLAQETFPHLKTVPAAIIPHGHYRDEYAPCEVGTREMLGIPQKSKVVLFFGSVRNYKNVEALVRAFKDVHVAEARLYVVGQPNSTELRHGIRTAAAADPRVKVVFEFLDNNALAQYLHAADLVALPYRSILNSGSALLALSLNRPVLVPDLGSMIDLENDFGSSWVRTFSGPITSDLLESGLLWAAQNQSPVCTFPPKYDWSSIRTKTIDFYKCVSRSGGA